MEVLSTARDVAAVVAATIGIVSLVIAAYNTSINRRTNRAQFWVDLRQLFATHDRVHRLLRPAGAWASESRGPSNPDEWADVEAYLGLFEVCEDLIAQNLIDAGTFKKGYAYRISNILENRPICRAKLVENAEYWARFLSLTKRMDLEVRCDKAAAPQSLAHVSRHSNEGVASDF